MNNKKNITREDYISKKEIIEFDIDLKKIEEKYNNNENLDDLERFLLVLILKEEEKLREVSKGDEMLEKIVDKIVELSSDESMIEMYEEEKTKRSTVGLPEDNDHLKIVVTQKDYR